MKLIALAFVIVVTLLIIILTLIKSDLHYRYKALTSIALILLWLHYTDLILTPTKTYQSTTEKIIVSSAPSSSELSGSWILGFGSISTSRYYLLREEVSDGLYKDFQVKYEVYIREDKSLTTKGKFIQISNCTVRQWEYELLWFTLYGGETYTSCNFSRQEIVVPVGYVIKDLTI
jgi:hypothetical protein